MPDKLSQVGKSLGQTKKDAETALRRYQPKHPKVDRIRDVFDDTIPFEMEFKTEDNETLFHMDLYFNKPPPLSGCNGRYDYPCQEFLLSSGDHLVQVTSRYKQGSVVVFRNGIRLLSGFSEYDPEQGLIFLQGLTTETIAFNICYIIDSWVTCPPDYVAPSFTGSVNFQLGDYLPNYEIQTTNGGVFSTITASEAPTNEGGSMGITFFPDLSGLSPLPPADNVRMTWVVSFIGDNFGPGSTGDASLGWTSSFGQWTFLNDPRLPPGVPDALGFYIGSEKISDALGGAVTVDCNFERGTAIISGPGGGKTISLLAAPISYSTAITHVFDFKAPLSSDAYSSAALIYFEIGCSLESPNG